jgi:hypothetical protein
MSAEATLLVIDDEPDVLTIVEQFAQRFGFKVVGRRLPGCLVDRAHSLLLLLA